MDLAAIVEPFTEGRPDLVKEKNVPEEVPAGALATPSAKEPAPKGAEEVSTGKATLNSAREPLKDVRPLGVAETKVAEELFFIPGLVVCWSVLVLL